MADPGEGPGDPVPPSFLDQTETRRAKNVFEETIDHDNRELKQRRF